MGGPGHVQRRIYVLILLALALSSCVSVPETQPEGIVEQFPEQQPFAESRFATIGGVRLHYRVWTPDDSAPVGKILLLHALGGSTFSYRYLGPILAEYGFAVVAVDLPAFGFSDIGIRFDHSLANRSELLWTFLDRLDTEQNSFPPASGWYLLGHDMGGQVTTRMTLDRPGRTLGLIVVGSAIANPSPTGTMLWVPIVRWAVRSWLLNSVYTIEGVTEMLTDAYGRPPTDEEVAGYLAPLLRKDMDRGFIRFARTSRTFDLPLEELKPPVLLAWGGEDTWVELSEGAAAHARIPDSEMVVIPGAGHVPMDTDPQALADEIIDWVEYQWDREQIDR